jgi:hypothetical protein
VLCCQLRFANVINESVGTVCAMVGERLPATFLPLFYDLILLLWGVERCFFI